MDEHLECEICGGTDFYKESGHYWCNECQTQSQQVQEHVFERDIETINKKSTRKIQKDKSEKTEQMLSSWECYNIVLKNLTDELINLGANSGIKPVVKCLWMSYLRKLEVFSLDKETAPKMSLLGSKKDIQILYKVPKRKRRRSGSVSTSTSISAKRQLSGKKRKLVNKQYEELSQSQSLTQDSVKVETLSSLKSESEQSDSSIKIEYNKLSKGELKYQQKRNETPKIRSRNVRPIFQDLNLSLFTPYCLLYIALLITGDELQLGDLLRFIRQGQLTSVEYEKYFEEGMKVNLPSTREKVLSSNKFRQRTAKVIRFLDVGSFIHIPDLVRLAKRYCTELNLPDQVYECVRKILLKTQPKMKKFHGKVTALPNYEARAMSCIVFTLKLLFGLDGVTESKLSQYSELFPDMFNVNQWLQSVLYRQQLLLSSHLPSQMLHNEVDSTLFAHTRQTSNNPKHIALEMKDYLQVLERVNVVKSEPSLTSVKEDPSLTSCAPGSSFQSDRLDFLLRPCKYLHLVHNKRVINGGANNNIVKKRWLYLYKNTVYVAKEGYKVHAVKISDTEDLAIDTSDPYINPDPGVYMDNWQKGNAKDFLVNKELLKSESELATPQTTPSGQYNTHYNPFERYWLHVPVNPNSHNFARKDAVAILDELPFSFRTIINECARICDQDVESMFGEFLVTECYLVFVAKFGCKSRKNKKQVKEVKFMAETCKKFW